MYKTNYNDYINYNGLARDLIKFLNIYQRPDDTFTICISEYKYIKIAKLKYL